MSLFLIYTSTLYCVLSGAGAGSKVEGRIGQMPVLLPMNTVKKKEDKFGRRLF